MTDKTDVIFITWNQIHTPKNLHGIQKCHILVSCPKDIIIPRYFRRYCESCLWSCTYKVKTWIQTVNSLFDRFVVRNRIKRFIIIHSHIHSVWTADWVGTAFLHIKWVRTKSQISHPSHIFPLSLSLQGCAEYTNALGNNNSIENGARIRRGFYIQSILTNLVYLNIRPWQMTQKDYWMTSKFWCTLLFLYWAQCIR